MKKTKSTPRARVAELEQSHAALDRELRETKSELDERKIARVEASENLRRLMQRNAEIEGLGMSLRDWFAGQASESDIAMHRGSWVAEEKPPYTREEAKYRYADAMLAARTKGARK